MSYFSISDLLTLYLIVGELNAFFIATTTRRDALIISHLIMSYFSLSDQNYTITGGELRCQYIETTKRKHAPIISSLNMFNFSLSDLLILYYHRRCVTMLVYNNYLQSKICIGNFTYKHVLFFSDFMAIIKGGELRCGLWLPL